MTTLPYKVFNPAGQYVAATRHPSDAAVLVSALGNGAEIRNGHSKRDSLWREGAEQQAAGESYDFVAETVLNRAEERWNAVQQRMAAMCSPNTQFRDGEDGRPPSP